MSFADVAKMSAEHEDSLAESKVGARWGLRAARCCRAPDGVLVKHHSKSNRVIWGQGSIH